MAPNDAEMPDHQALSDDLQEISKHISTLRQGVENLVGSLGRAGSHQAGRLQDNANEALSAVEDAIRREPLKALGIALGLGLLLGVILRR
jgi:ElaB/YqjD/DUF883 family membrane-anchored ribosome-binding protein